MMSARRERKAVVAPWAVPIGPPHARGAEPAVAFRVTPRPAPPSFSLPEAANGSSAPSGGALRNYRLNRPTREKAS